jgi:hypothetical protein
MRDNLPESRLRTAAPQVQVRLVGQRREEVEAVLEHLQKTAGLEVLRGVQPGKKGDWLAYASVSIPPAIRQRESEGDHE